MATSAPGMRHGLLIVGEDLKESDMYDLELARQRHAEVQRDAEQLAFRRRVLKARRWEKRAAHASQRARQASQALW